MSLSSHTPESDYAPVEHTFYRPGSESYSGEVPMIVPAWQYRIDYDDLPAQTMHDPSCKGVWTYEPFTGEDATPEYYIMSDVEIENHDKKLEEWNVELVKFKYTTSTNHLGHSLFILHSDTPLLPMGIDAPHVIKIPNTDKIPVKSGYIEMHIAFDSAEAMDQYQEDSDQVFEALCDTLEPIDLRRINMDVKVLAVMLCMLEIRSIIDGLEGEMTVDETRRVTDYALVEAKARGYRSIGITDAHWEFARAIYDAREPLNLFA